MNNLTFGDKNMGYYETIAGGAGAGPHWHGRSGVHTHMTNTCALSPLDPGIQQCVGGEVHDRGGCPLSGARSQHCVRGDSPRPMDDRLPTWTPDISLWIIDHSWQSNLPNFWC